MRLRRSATLGSIVLTSSRTETSPLPKPSIFSAVQFQRDPLCTRSRTRSVCPASSLCAARRFKVTGARHRYDYNPEDKASSGESTQGGSSFFSSAYSAFTGPAEEDAVTLLRINADHLEKTDIVIDQKAMGIPFHIKRISDILERVRLHHGLASATDITVHSVQRLLLPFWLCTTAAAGDFKAEILQRDPAYLTSSGHVWVRGPRYEFNFPFEDYLPMNQACACYTDPLPLVEECLRGSHVPSMLISRFELLQELEEEKKTFQRQQEREFARQHPEHPDHKKACEEAAEQDEEEEPLTPPPPLQIVPFAMSTSTALTVVEKRVTREVVMEKIELELLKYHGHYLKSSVHLTGVSFKAKSIRPIFLPVYKLLISTGPTSAGAGPTLLPMYVCGATGKTAGPVLHAPPSLQRLWMVGSGVTAAALTLALSNVSTHSSSSYGAATVSVATSVPVALMAVAAVAASLFSLSFLHAFRLKALQQKEALWTAELKKASVLNLPSDESGYRWTVTDEERQEYEYREQLRHEARKKAAFQERLREEFARDEAQRGRHVDARARRRTDLINVDPLGYYAILGLTGKELSATQKEITTAFRQAVQVHHPDVVQQKPEEPGEEKSAVEEQGSGEGGERRREAAAVTHMQKLIEAYKILSSKTKRKEYDSGKMARSETGGQSSSDAASS